MTMTYDLLVMLVLLLAGSALFILLDAENKR